MNEENIKRLIERGREQTENLYSRLSASRISDGAFKKATLNLDCSSASCDVVAVDGPNPEKVEAIYRLKHLEAILR